MWFYAGVLQEGVRIVQDRLGRTPIAVSWCHICCPALPLFFARPL